MSVPSNLNKIVYNGNGVTTTWSYTFPIILSTDLEVILTDNTGVDQAPLSSNYTIDTVNSVVTYPTVGSPLPSGWKLTLLRVEPITQLTTLTTQGAFSAANIERALDKLTMILQQHDETFSRVPQYPVSQTPSASDTTSFINTVAASAAAAAASSASAAVYAAALAGTSVTSNTIGTGAKTFTTQSGKQWGTGQYVIIVDSANSANYMIGQVTSYTGTTLIINSIATGGSGTKTSWNIYVAGAAGPTGPNGAAAAMTRATFTNGTLSAGVLTVTHSLALSAPYTLVIWFFDNNGKQVYPDITGATNSLTADFSNFGTLSGTWGYVYWPA